jgi:hypothetical protein
MGASQSIIYSREAESACGRLSDAVLRIWMGTCTGTAQMISRMSSVLETSLRYSRYLCSGVEIFRAGTASGMKSAMFELLVLGGLDLSVRTQLF